MARSIPPQPAMTDSMAGRYLTRPAGQTITEAIAAANATPSIGAKRVCPDCRRPQHYTGHENGWAHDALIDTWECADPRKAGA